MTLARLTGAPLRRQRGAADEAHGHQIFTGKLARKHLSFPDRAMVSAIRAEEGDFRNWAQIRAWAASVADTLLT